MAVDPAPASGTTRERPQAALDSIWRGPLVPVALAVTAGVVADRYGSLSLGTAFAAVVVALSRRIHAVRATARAASA